MKLLALLNVCLFAVACQASPLFNHRNAEELNRATVMGDECQLVFPTNNLCGQIEWVKGPTEEEASEFFVYFWPKGEKKDPFVTPSAQVGAKLWMPGMGHGSAPVKLAPAKNADGSVRPGVFHVTDVYFTMGGHWEVWVALKNTTNNTTEKAKIDVHL